MPSRRGGLGTRRRHWRRVAWVHPRRYVPSPGGGQQPLRPAPQSQLPGHPPVVFADPEIAAVGLSADGARANGINAVTAEIDLAESIARSWTYEKDPGGALGIVADADRQVLVGAWAVAPLAGEWIHQAALAIRASVPIDTLLDQVAQFPTYSEAYLQALEALSF